MGMLDISQISGLPMANGLLAMPQPTFGFDGPPPPPAPPVDPAVAAAEAQEAREAAARRLAVGQRRPLPPMEEGAAPFAGPAGPMGAGNLPTFGSLAPPAAAPPQGGFPPSLGNLIATPPGIGGPPDDGATLPPKSTPVSTIPNVPNPQPRSTGAPPLDIAPPPQAAPQGPGFLRSLSNGIQTVAGILNPEVGARNQTVDALIKHGIDPEMARALAVNPQALQQILTGIAGGKKPIMMPNGMVLSADGTKVINDFSEAGQWKPTVVKNREGEDETVLLQPSTGAIKKLIANGVTPAQPGGPASANVTLPPQVQKMSPAEQFKNAPDGSTATIGGRPVIRRAGRWEYQ